jgi:uncharacterized protein
MSHYPEKYKSFMQMFEGFTIIITILMTIIIIPGISSATAAAASLATSQAIPVLVVAADEFTTSVYPGSGQVSNMTIDITEGHGRVLINTNINSGGAWQNSTKTAAHVAQSLTHKDLSSKDIIFTAILANASRQVGTIDGPSAGGAMTVLLISELEGKPINNYTVMTGTINPDGTIGKVGGVLEKADAAGKYGAKLMLVPAGQSYYPEGACLPQRESSKNQGNNNDVRLCLLEFKSLSDLMESRYGMRVVGVHNVQEALSYFQSTDLNNQTLAGNAGLINPAQQGGAQ